MALRDGGHPTACTAQGAVGGWGGVPSAKHMGVPMCLHFLDLDLDLTLRPQCHGLASLMSPGAWEERGTFTAPP